MIDFRASDWTGTQETVKAQKRGALKNGIQRKPFIYLDKSHFSFAEKGWW
jgi:hypothetical protein